MDESRPRSRPLILLLALVFLFETWVWDSAVAVLGWVARRIPWQRMRRAIKNVINTLPAFVAVLLFGVPVVAMEAGSAMAVVFVALGHVMVGALLYGFMKLLGVSLIAVIYDLTQEKLLSLPWFAWLHGKFERLHHMARAFVEPYRQLAIAKLSEWRESASAVLRRWGLDFGRARREARAPKSGALASDAEFD